MPPLPLQIGTQNSLEILEDPKAEVVDEIAAKLGLRKVAKRCRRARISDPGFSAAVTGGSSGINSLQLPGVELRRDAF